MFTIITKDNGNLVIISSEEDKQIEIRQDLVLVFSDKESPENN